jgi:hypothetical protein
MVPSITPLILGFGRGAITLQTETRTPIPCIFGGMDSVDGIRATKINTSEVILGPWLWPGLNIVWKTGYNNITNAIRYRHRQPIAVLARDIKQEKKDSLKFIKTGSTWHRTSCPSPWLRLNGRCGKSMRAQSPYIVSRMFRSTSLGFG